MSIAHPTNLPVHMVLAPSPQRAETQICSRIPLAPLWLNLCAPPFPFWAEERPFKERQLVTLPVFLDCCATALGVLCVHGSGRFFFLRLRQPESLGGWWVFWGMKPMNRVLARPASAPQGEGTQWRHLAAPHPCTSAVGWWSPSGRWVTNNSRPASSGPGQYVI